MRRYLLIAAGLVLIPAIAAGAYAWELHYAKAFFVEALRNANVQESVNVGGIQYTVSDGTIYVNGNVYTGSQALDILSLAYEEAWARRHPPFSLSGTDPSELLVASGQLKATQAQLASLQATSTDASLVGSSLYPIDFLTAAAQLEQTRQNFLQSGTQENASAYVVQLGITETTYQTDISNFRSAFEQAVPENVGGYATEHDVVSRSGTLAALQTLSSEANGIERHTVLQKWCLAGVAQLCDPADVQFPSLPNATSSGTPSIELLQAAQVRAIYAQAGVSLGTTTIELLQSSCLQNGASPLFAIFGGDQISWVGDIRFVRAEDYSTVPFYQYFLQHGIQLAYLTPTVYYECPNIGTDWGLIFGALQVRTFAEQIPLSRYATGSEAASLRSLETSLESPLLRESDAIAYLRDGESLAERGALPLSVENELISLSLTMNDTSAGFDSLVSEIALVEHTNADLVRSGVPVDLGASYVFYVRNALAPFFFADNGSLNPSGDLFSPDTIPLDEQPYVFYLSTPRTGESPLVLARDISLFSDLHQGVLAP